ncbi:MAG: NADAR family protein [Saprospiraceae bacterium]|nr:NADAR family protein [Saprospiraceae bacterium]
MNYSLKTIQQEFSEGKHMDFLFFWGHQPKKDGSISKSCFSQWWIAPFTHEGIEYKTAEHFMMAGKAKLFGDKEMEEQIIQTNSPREAKALGRKVRNFDNATWQENCYQIVKKANILKFSQNEALKSFLLQTESKILVEASPVDPIWGIGMAEDNTEVNNPMHWKGKNLLGFILMEIRDEL